ncbi:MAG: hypothetical protein V7K30_07710 [Nostoc sp.]
MAVQRSDHRTACHSDRTKGLIFMHLTDNLCHAIAPRVYFL